MVQRPQCQCFATQAFSVQFVLDGVAFWVSHPDNFIHYFQEFIYIKHIGIQVPSIQWIVNGGKFSGCHAAISVTQLIVDCIVGSSIGKSILTHQVCIRVEHQPFGARRVGGCIGFIDQIFVHRFQNVFAGTHHQQKRSKN
jgi:hypothetical protein